MTSNSKSSPENKENLTDENEIEKGLKIKELQNFVLKRILEEKNQDLNENPPRNKKKHPKK